LKEAKNSPQRTQRLHKEHKKEFFYKKILSVTKEKSSFDFLWLQFLGLSILSAFAIFRTLKCNSLAPARLALTGCLTAVDPAAATPHICFVKNFIL